MSFLSARKKAGLTQADVASEVGVSAAAVCQWETGATVPKAKLLPVIAKLLNCTVDELLKPEAPQPNK